MVEEEGARIGKALKGKGKAAREDKRGGGGESLDTAEEGVNPGGRVMEAEAGVGGTRIGPWACSEWDVPPPSRLGTWVSEDEDDDGVVEEEEEDEEEEVGGLLVALRGSDVNDAIDASVAPCCWCWCWSMR